MIILTMVIQKGWISTTMSNLVHGTYSTHLFARKAGEIVKQHAASQPDKVGLCQSR